MYVCICEISSSYQYENSYQKLIPKYPTAHYTIPSHAIYQQKFGSQLSSNSMLSSKRSIKTVLTTMPTKPRSKSIYRGDQSHTLSMHIRIDNEVSPDRGSRLPSELGLQHKYSYKEKENRIQAFREGLKMSQSGNLGVAGKKTDREELESRSSKKLNTGSFLETERVYRQQVGTYRKQGAPKLDKTSSLYKDKDHRTLHKIEDEEQSQLQQPQQQQIGIECQELRNMLMAMKKLAKQNRGLKKELSVLVGKGVGSSVGRALAG